MNDRDFAHARSAFQRQQADLRSGLSPVCSPLANGYLPELERRAAGGPVEPTPTTPDYYAIAAHRLASALMARRPRRWWGFWR